MVVQFHSAAPFCGCGLPRMAEWPPLKRVSLAGSIPVTRTKFIAAWITTNGRVAKLKPCDPCWFNSSRRDQKFSVDRGRANGYCIRSSLNHESPHVGYHTWKPQTSSLVALSSTTISYSATTAVALPVGPSPGGKSGENGWRTPVLKCRFSMRKLYSCFVERSLILRG